MQKVQIKNANKASSVSQSMTGKEKQFVKFFGEVKKEINRVSWTSKEELKTATKVVLIAVISLAAVIYFFDLFIRGSLTFLQFITQWMFG